MKASELRLGNFVSLFGSSGAVEFPLTEPRLIRVLTGEYNIEPIPLTEEWLFKFGFKGPGFRDYWEHTTGGDFPDLLKVDGIWEAHVMGNFDTIAIAQIRYVNQLQNLYFCLTGEELTIKQTTNA